MTSRWREWRGLVVFVAVMLLFRSAVADWNQVPSGSMLPSILIGDRIMVDKLAYDLRIPFTRTRIARWADPARGDIVTFVSPEDERLLVKRVIGLPGDMVALTDNRLSINGTDATYQLLSIPPGMARRSAAPRDANPAGYAQYLETVPGNAHRVMLRGGPSGAAARSFAPRRIPPGHYLMLGDNRDNSRDSRVIGLIARDRILGKASRIAFSLDYEAFYAPRLDRFFTTLH